MKTRLSPLAFHHDFFCVCGGSKDNKQLFESNSVLFLLFFTLISKIWGGGGVLQENTGGPHHSSGNVSLNMC